MSTRGREWDQGASPVTSFPAPGPVGRRLRSSPLASGAWGRSQSRQHCGAIKETGSALTAAGAPARGQSPGEGRPPRHRGQPRGGEGRRRGRLGKGRSKGVGEGALALGPASLARGPCHLGFSPHELQPECCLLSAGRKRSAGQEREAAVCRAVMHTASARRLKPQTRTV